MKMNKSVLAMVTLGIMVIAGVAATQKPADGYKNLKILHKDISHEELGKLMHNFNDALGVKCNFCHAASKDDEKKMDFASDDKPEKAIARSMMKMTNRINKKFFHGKTKLGDADAVFAVNCETCHHGEPHPEFEKKEEPKN